MTPRDSLSRPRRELDAARLLADGGFGAQSTSRAYYAAFYAAKVALDHLGVERSKRSGVVAAFIRLVVREGGADQDAGRLLRSLFERRTHADYSTAPVSAEDAGQAIADATAVVDAVESWLAR